MREDYDVKTANPRPNPQARELKQQITIKIAPTVIQYFKEESARTSIPYQTLINMYLADCVKSKRRLDLSWRPA
ncbi:MAG TPA: antitoxin [Sutterella sp.]|jgi:predicted DNA binding CopG/RHH family protein|nr:antitoxin [Sutterella sp.]